MSLGGGLGLRNTLIFFGVFNIIVILVAAIINNLFPDIPFAEIITAYVNLFLTTTLLFLAGTVGFAEIVFNVGSQIVWALMNFLWTLLFGGITPAFLTTAPVFNFTALTELFVGLFEAIINQPLIIQAPVSDEVSAVVGGIVTSAVVTNGNDNGGNGSDNGGFTDLTPEQQEAIR